MNFNLFFFLYNSIYSIKEFPCKDCKHCLTLQYSNNVILEKCFLFTNRTNNQLMNAYDCRLNKNLCNGFFFNKKCNLNFEL